jgi:hypothetical protein
MTFWCSEQTSAGPRWVRVFTSPSFRPLFRPNMDGRGVLLMSIRKGPWPSHLDVNITFPLHLLHLRRRLRWRHRFFSRQLNGFLLRRAQKELPADVFTRRSKTYAAAAAANILPASATARWQFRMHANRRRLDARG